MSIVSPEMIAAFNAVFDNSTYDDLDPASYDMAVQEAIEAALNRLSPFPFGSLVRKKSGSWWEGRVVGFYSTEQTPAGVAVQLDRPDGPVQIYPASALELAESHGDA